VHGSAFLHALAANLAGLPNPPQISSTKLPAMAAVTNPWQPRPSPPAAPASIHGCPRARLPFLARRQMDILRGNLGARPPPRGNLGVPRGNLGPAILAPPIARSGIDGRPWRIRPLASPTHVPAPIPPTSRDSRLGPPRRHPL
jgi:hypothetical protein